jgi:CRISPR-associated endonuclease/helicase Cas3
VLLHGRFILRDREGIEKVLKEVDLLVGTQAIEVSLDIDYDVIYTEPAPIDALIQRFGRVNRKGWENNRIAPAYVFSEGSENDKYIYNQDTVKRTLDELSKLDLLYEDLVQEVVDKIYEKGYSGKDKEDFETVRRNFKPFYDKIVPFIHDKRNADDFYLLYQSYEVVPYQYKLQYLEEVEKGHYLDAMSYFTSISIGQYKKLEKESRVELDQHTRFVNVPYDKKLGLLLGEERNTIL